MWRSFFRFYQLPGLARLGSWKLGPGSREKTLHAEIEISQYLQELFNSLLYEKETVT